jgi:tetratricopeptide (TPR) repeat protein
LVSKGTKLVLMRFNTYQSTHSFTMFHLSTASRNSVSAVFTVIITSGILITSCTNTLNRDRQIFEIEQHESDLSRLYNQTGRSEATLSKSTELRDAYIRFADSWRTDSLSAEYLFQAAMLDADIREDVSNGLAYLERIATEYPDHPIHSKTLFLIGFTYAEQLNQFDKAREAYQQYLELYPEGEMAPSVRIELDNLGIRPSFEIHSDSTEVDLLRD